MNNEQDYTQRPKQIADTLSRGGSPLSEDQYALLVGAMAFWQGHDTQEIERVRQELEEYKERPIADVRTYQNKIDELAAYVNRLREGIFVTFKDGGIYNLKLSAEQVPSQSLQQHNNELIERCIEVTRQNAGSIHRIFEGLKELKDGKD